MDIWVGRADGSIHLYSLEMEHRLRLVAHEEPVIALTTAGRRVYSLAMDGAGRGWYAGLPKDGDQDCWEMWQQMAPECMQMKRFQVHG